MVSPRDGVLLGRRDPKDVLAFSTSTLLLASLRWYQMTSLGGMPGRRVDLDFYLHRVFRKKSFRLVQLFRDAGPRANAVSVHFSEKSLQQL